jgi:hypothetical protein
MGKFDFNKDFSVKMDKIIANSKEKMFAVFKDSFQDLIEEASTPVDAGGKMRVDTGFLRSTGSGAINAVPRGESEGRKRLPGEIGILPEYSNYDFTKSLQSLLLQMKPNNTIYWGWSANYAKYRELYDGFLISACENWKNYVDNNTRRLKK